MKKALLVVLVIVLAAGALVVVSCGGADKEAKAALTTALETVNAEQTALTKTLTSGGTVADLKAAKEEMATAWQAAVTAADGIEGADIPAAQKAWDDLAAAIDAVPDDATMAEAGTMIAAQVGVLMGEKTKLQELAGETK